MYLSKRKGSGNYYLWFHDSKGRKRKVSTRCNRKNDALQFLKEFREKQKVRQRIPLNDFAFEYLKHSATKHTYKTVKTNESVLREFVRIIGNLPLDKIGIREIEKFLSVKASESSVYTVRRVFVHLASAFETAKRWEYVSENPFRRIDKPKIKETAPKYIKKAEFKKLLDVIDDIDLRELVITAVSTGMRGGEIRALLWKQIDLINRVIHIQNTETFQTKSKKNRVIPMSENLYRLLAKRKERAVCEFVFHNRMEQISENDLSKTFKRYVLDAGINLKCNFHSLRHTFGSWLAQSGVSLYEIQKLMGHSSIGVTEKYAFLSPDMLHSTVEKIRFELPDGEPVEPQAIENI
jgi:integrase